MLVGVSLSGQVVRLVARRHVVPVDVLVARRHVDREDVLGARLAFAVIDHSALRPAASQSRRRGKGVAMAIIRTKGERINVGLGIHLLLLGQSRRDKRQGGGGLFQTSFFRNFRARTGARRPSRRSRTR
jgi:hypothetical protein